MPTRDFRRSLGTGKPLSFAKVFVIVNSAVLCLKSVGDIALADRAPLLERGWETNGVVVWRT